MRFGYVYGFEMVMPEEARSVPDWEQKGLISDGRREGIVG